MSKTITSFLIGALLLLSGCGGGGGGSNTENTNSNTTPIGNTVSYDLDALGVPKFVSTNYINLTQKDINGNYLINRISKFRSSDGHDYSDTVESCRSMKHYFKDPNSATEIFSPVAGTITTIYEEWAGTQLHITSDKYPAIKFIIFHVSMSKPFVKGEKVTEGFKLGTHIGTQTSSDIAVEVNTPTGRRLISYFETLNDSALKPFTDRNPTFFTEAIISKAQRDAAPLTCAGEVFTSTDVLDRDFAF